MMPSTPARLFVAILPADPVRAALAGLMDGVGQARWTPPANLHLTLRFIGPVPPGAEERIEAALGGVRVQPFLLAADGTGRFPPRGQAGVLWAGVDGHPHLQQLRQQVDDRLLAAGIAFELRPFVPHFTLARVADASAGAVAQWLKRHRDFAGPAWRVDAFHLMASLAGAGGTEYRVRRTFPLQGAT